MNIHFNVTVRIRLIITLQFKQFSSMLLTSCNDFPSTYFAKLKIEKHTKNNESDIEFDGAPS